MYRIGEAANMLNIEKTVIFEKMINNSKELSLYIVKENSITFITQKGIEILDDLIHNRKIVVEENQNEIDFVEDVEVSVNDCNDNDDGDEFISEEDLENINKEKKKIKDEIFAVRNKLLTYDTELKRLDEAILNYEAITKEDLEWIRVNEGKIKYRLNQII